MTDDNEEIFRRAAENYPLNTANADWETVHKKMEADTNHHATGNTGSKKRNYRPLLLLLLLLFIAVIENKYHFLTGNTKEKAIPAVASANGIASKTTGQTNSTDKENTLNAVAINKTSSSVSGSDKTNTAPGGGVVSAGTGSNDAAINPAHHIISSSHSSAETNTGTAASTITQKKNKTSPAINSGQEKINIAHNKASYTSKQKTSMEVMNAQASTDEDDRAVSTEKNSAPLTDDSKEKFSTDANISIVKEETQEKKLEPGVKTTPGKEITKTTAKADVKEDKKSKSGQKHFYAGLIGGPDFSAIKLQSVKKTGLSFGLIAGYRINNRFSIETGFLKDKKFYSSKGEYFSTKQLRMPVGADIEYVEGNCNMYEVPLNVYYNFSNGKRSSWFGSTGISSYFMNKESYNFNVKRNGETYPYGADYKKQDNQFAAVINFSAGYSHKLGKLGDLRIEPYLKLPVNKIGTGDMPIQSAGVLIGFTRILF